LPRSRDEEATDNTDEKVFSVQFQVMKRFKGGKVPLPSAVRRDIFVENRPNENLSPIGATY